MKRKCGHTRQPNSDTTARPMQHVSDTKNPFSATIMAASSYGRKTLPDPLPLMERMPQYVPIWPAKPMYPGGLSIVPSELRRDDTCDCTPATNATCCGTMAACRPSPDTKHRAINAPVATGDPPGPTPTVASQSQWPQNRPTINTIPLPIDNTVLLFYPQSGYPPGTTSPESRSGDPCKSPQRSARIF